MGLAVIPTDWTEGYIDYLVQWPNSEEWQAILRGLLSSPYQQDFWDLFTGDPTEAQEAIELTFDTNLHLEEGAMLPAGILLDYAGGTIPDGWLFCDGSTISRTTYSRLFAAIGETFGPGDGTTTFEIPDTLGRVTVGLNPLDEIFEEMGLTGGTQTVDLTISEMPDHTHTQNSHGHTQNSHGHTQNSHGHTQNAHDHVVFGSNIAAAGAAIRAPVLASGGSNVISQGTVATNQGTVATNQDTTATNQSTTATNQNSGGGLPHSNLQPYVVFPKIIKT